MGGLLAIGRAESFPLEPGAARNGESWEEAVAHTGFRAHVGW